MRALTLWQPWASLVAAGVKTVETRSWRPPKGLVGQRIAIHAASRKITSHDRRFNEAVSEVLGLADVRFSAETVLRSELPRGAVLCTARLREAWQVAEVSDDLVRVATSADGQSCVVDAWGDFSPGRWLWFLEDLDTFSTPFTARGKQGMWEWSDAS